MPITISICDNDELQIKYLRSLLSKWAINKPFAISIYEYESAEIFLFQYENNPCDLLLLDIEMGKLNGMELAKKLRLKDDMLPIIFITGFGEYISDGYDVEALHYLLKPIEENKFYQVLDKFIEKNKTKSSEILVQIPNGTVHISIDKIMYVEAFGRVCQMFLSDEKVISCEMGIGEFREMNIADFVTCHRSYVVNLQFVKAITKTDIILDNEKKIPLSRRLYNDVNKQFIAFYTGGK